MRPPTTPSCRRVLFWMVALATIVSTAAGAEPRLAQVLESVKRSHPTVLAAWQDVSTAEADLLSAEGAFDRSVRLRGTAIPTGPYESTRVDLGFEQPTTLWGSSFSAGYRWGGGVFPSYDGKFETNDAGELRVGASVPLWRGGPVDRRRGAIIRGRWGVEVARASALQSELEMIRAATDRYWAYVAALERRRLAILLRDGAVARDAWLVQRVSEGDIPAFDQLDNRRSIAQREAAVVSAQRGVQQAAFELGLYWRDGDGQPRVIEPSADDAFPDRPAQAPETGRVDTALTRASSGRPEVVRLMAQAAQFQADRDVAENLLAPGIDLGTALSRDLGQGLPKRDKLDWEVGLSVDLPVQTRAAQGRVQAAQAGAQKVDLQLRLARDRIGVDVQDAASAWRAAEQRLEALRSEWQLASEVEAGERTRYEHGEGTLFLVNQRELQTLETALRVVDARVELERARSAWALAQARWPTDPGVWD